MSGRTGIEWTDATWNPVVGCTKLSQGCKNCYAKSVHDRRHKALLAGKSVAPQYAQPFETVQLKPERLGAPLSWRVPRRIFVNSVSDLFQEDVPDEYIERVFTVMAKARRHTFQILTKRPERMLNFFMLRSLVQSSAELLAATNHGKDWPLPNVWLGVSVENQDAANERIPLLLNTPAAVRFLSCEPLLAPVDLTRWIEGNPECPAYDADCLGTDEDCHDACQTNGLHWIIAGGESGSSKQKVRPAHPVWVQSLRDQCVSAGVPFFFKQWGHWVTEDQAPEDGIEKLSTADHVLGAKGPAFWAAGKKRAGRLLDGRTWDQFPVRA